MAAPDLPGLTLVGALGSGGFAEVYAYDQLLPRRRVAVKVLRDPARTGGAASAFLAEADALAAVSHPHIVAIHSVGVAPDGRPYLVMPLLPGGSLGLRASASPLSAADVLRLGIQLAGAVETAHRRGLLHRDIKPNNILLDGYGEPALADFGLVGSSDDPEEESGVSVPWAPPEALFGPGTSASSDVYSLAATLWTLAAGRAPFQCPEGDNSPAATARRIRLDPVPPIGRPEVPAALEAVLAGALAKEPGGRPETALALAHELQRVQRQLGLPVTEPVVASPDEGRPVRPSAPAPALASGLLGDAGPESPDADDQRALAATDRRPAARATDSGSAASDRPEAPRAGKPVGRLSWAVAALVLAGVCVGAWLLLGRDAGAIVTVTSARSGERVTFSWSYPDPRPGDAFDVTVADRVVRLTSPALGVDSAARVCVRVQVVDAAGRPRPAAGEGCSP